MTKTDFNAILAEQNAKNAEALGANDNEPRRRGRPRKLALVRDEMVSSARQPQAGGRATALGRDNSVLTRKRPSEVDKFAIPLNLIPDGWTYEWKRKSIFGMNDDDHVTGLMENGWRPVPAERHAGQFMVRGGSGEIVRDGLLLMERPLSLTLEARAEEKQNAKMLIAIQNEQYGAKLPAGMDGNHPGARARINTSYEPGPQGAGLPLDPNR